MNAAEVYARERDEAFMAFVYDGDFAHIDALVDKWGLSELPHDDVCKAAIYKAVQEIAATLGGECELEYGGDVTEDTKRVLGVYFCSECGSPNYNDCMPYFCIYCGKAVKR